MKIITDLSVTSARMRPRAGWTPHLLFSADGVGAWYDIADTSTLFADMAGLDPAVVNGPVGLILDKSRALATGPELVSNGNFDVDHSGWSVAGPVDVTTSGGVVAVDQPGATGGIFQDIPLTAGELAQISVRARRLGPATTMTGIWAMSAGNFVTDRVVRSLSTDWADYVFYTRGSSTAARIYVTSQVTGGSIQVESISARVLAGNHARQTVFAARPILRQNGSGSIWLEFDGVDDRLTTPSLDLSHTDAVTLFAGFSKAATPPGGSVLCGFSDGGLRAFSLHAPAAGSTGSRWTHGGETATTHVEVMLGLEVPTVYCCGSDLGASVAEIYQNGILAGSATDITGGGTFTSGPLGIGDLAGSSSQPFAGKLSGLLVLDRMVTDAERNRMTVHMMADAGVTP